MNIIIKYISFVIGTGVLAAGCASSDRIVRMSGGVLDEYSAPSGIRIRSEKYQKVSRELSSSVRADKNAVAGMDDTLINIWPFFFCSNAYWSALWPFIDKDPYGFAIRPFYNHEGDDYSILFPLTAWNNASGNGWVLLWAWNKNGCGLVPFNWQWQEKESGGSWLFPLWDSSYDHRKLYYRNRNDNLFWVQEQSSWIIPVYYSRGTQVDNGQWKWLFGSRFDNKQFRNEWNYRFAGKREYPANAAALEKYRQEVFDKLPRIESKSFWIIPFYIGEYESNGDFLRRYFLLAGEQKTKEKYSFDVMGKLFGLYETSETHTGFCSWALLSCFDKAIYEKNSPLRQKFNNLSSLIRYDRPFSQQKPAMADALKAIDPALKLPETVVDYHTCNLYFAELRKKYDFPTGVRYEGLFFPFFKYTVDAEKSSWCVLPLLTWGKRTGDGSEFFSLPLLSRIKTDKKSEKTEIFARLVYYSDSEYRMRRDYKVFDRNKRSVTGDQCSELHDIYALGGLFYRGKFGFNVVKGGYKAEDIETLRVSLKKLPGQRSVLNKEQQQIVRETGLNDRWQTKGEIERLKKLIRYEELKIQTEKLHQRESAYMRDVNRAVEIAGKIGLKLDAATIGNKKSAEAAADRLLADYTELRFKEDIGNGLFFRREAFYNGDYNWHFLGIIAGGAKNGARESSHILHLLYRYRKEGNRSEKIIFPFISVVQDGDDSRFSVLWRVFSLSKRGSMISGHILFVSFGKSPAADQKK
ncbi:MAG: hypothetical protein IKA71_04070 [Lentisphaeria bacterium]|nr:hypothetical protein [Lentisphaeria bacterium]